jgi:hypothetical protein
MHLPSRRRRNSACYRRHGASKETCFLGEGWWELFQSRRDALARGELIYYHTFDKTNMIPRFNSIKLYPHQVIFPPRLLTCTFDLYLLLSKPMMRHGLSTSSDTAGSITPRVPCESRSCMASALRPARSPTRSPALVEILVRSMRQPDSSVDDGSLAENHLHPPAS